MKTPHFPGRLVPCNEFSPVPKNSSIDPHQHQVAQCIALVAQGLVGKSAMNPGENWPNSEEIADLTTNGIVDII
jgi:hypothetical protein